MAAFRQASADDGKRLGVNTFAKPHSHDFTAICSEPGPDASGVALRSDRR